MWSVNAHNFHNLWDQLGQSIGSVLWLPGQHPFDIYGAIPRESPGQLSNYEWWVSSSMWWRQLGSSSHFPGIPPNTNTTFPLWGIPGNDCPPYWKTWAIVAILKPPTNDLWLVLCSAAKKRFPDGPVARHQLSTGCMWCIFDGVLCFLYGPPNLQKSNDFSFFLTKQFHFQTG